VGGSKREGEDILLSECNGGGSSRVFCVKRSECEQDREMAYKKVQVLIKILKNRVL
jgi:hypothetical protein